MYKFKQLLGGVTFAGALVAAFLGAAPEAQAGANTCKNVKFQFTNSHPDGRDIQVVKVEHHSEHDGKWRTEDVANETCAPGSTCTTNGDNLSGVEGRDIDKVRFHYKVRDAAGNWSAVIVGNNRQVSGDQECKINKVYGPWAITG